MWESVESKQKGKGLGRLGSGTGGLGQRGGMSIEFGTEDIDVTGEIDREGIHRGFEANLPKFNRCYQLGLIEKPSIQGGLGMQWLISANGRVVGQGLLMIPWEVNRWRIVWLGFWRV